MGLALLGASSSMEIISPLLCLVFFVVLVVAAIGLSASLLARARAGRRTVIRRKIDQLARDFPDEVRAWGGPQALQNPQTVRAIIAKLERG
jgi:hypothetical protein